LTGVKKSNFARREFPVNVEAMSERQCVRSAGFQLGVSLLLGRFKILHA
jgi:hypothetical protein